MIIDTYLQSANVLVVEFVLDITKYDRRLTNSTFTQQHDFEVMRSRRRAGAHDHIKWLDLCEIIQQPEAECIAQEMNGR